MITYRWVEDFFSQRNEVQIDECQRIDHTKFCGICIIYFPLNCINSEVKSITQQKLLLFQREEEEEKKNRYICLFNGISSSRLRLTSSSSSLGFSHFFSLFVFFVSSLENEDMFHVSYIEKSIHMIRWLTIIYRLIIWEWVSVKYTSHRALHTKKYIFFLIHNIQYRLLRIKTFTHLILAMNLNDAHISHLLVCHIYLIWDRNQNKIHVKNALTTYKKISVKCDVNVIEILRNALRCYRVRMRAKHMWIKT